jgi:hypothetical protein
MVALGLPSCKKNDPDQQRNLPGRIMLDKQERWFLGHPTGATLTLTLTVFDPDGLAGFEIHGIARTFYTKKYPTACARRAKRCKGPRAQTREHLKLKLDISAWNDGKHELSLELEDLEGEIVKRKLIVVSDVSGPDIRIHSPLNLSRLHENTKVVFSVEDASQLREVRLMDNGNLLKTWAGNSVLFLKQTGKTPPMYSHSIDITALSPGTHRFEIIAEDRVGNRSRETVTVQVHSRGIGALCKNDEQCKKGMACIRRKFESLARCRKRCRYTRDCSKNHRCQRYAGKRLCFPVMRRFQNKAFGLCNQTYPCSESLICARMGLGKPRCYPRCGPRYPKCQKDTVCRLFRQTLLCAKPVKKRDKGLKEGKECSAKNVCRKELVCARFQGATPRCMRKCKARADCKSGWQCWKSKALKTGLCYQPKDMIPDREVGRFAICNSKTRCQKGLVCLGVQRAQKRCQKVCKRRSDCGENDNCVSMGAASFCTRACNPNDTSPCPNGLQCRFVPDLKNKVTYVCL